MKHKHITVSNRIKIEESIQVVSFRIFVSKIEKRPTTISKKFVNNLFVK